QNYSGRRIGPVAASETMQVRKARAISFKSEHRAIARIAPKLRRPIQNITRQHQSAQRTGSVPVSVVAELRERREHVQIRKTSAICVDFENRSIARTPAERRRPIQRVYR